MCEYSGATCMRREGEGHACGGGGMILKQENRFHEHMKFKFLFQDFREENSFSELVVANARHLEHYES